jgi:glycosyltransferase involved in cell wall biosynthesis
MNPNKVSVIIPVYNCELYLAEAIDSVLNQTYRSFEIIIIDDGSTDRSREVIKSFDNSRLRYSFQENKGSSSARNKGVQLARGEFFSFLDADDVWTQDKLALQMKAFERDRGLDMVFGHISQFLSPDVIEDLEAKNKLMENVLPGYSVGTILIKKDSFFRVGPFDISWRVGEFIDWYSKAQEMGLKHTLLDEVVMKRRIHGSNMGIRERSSQEDYFRILKSALDRRLKNDPKTE